MATFFDLFEDGRPDILSVMGNPENGFKLAAYTNTSQDSDAYFVKVRDMDIFTIHSHFFIKDKFFLSYLFIWDLE